MFFDGGDALKRVIDFFLEAMTFSTFSLRSSRSRRIDLSSERMGASSSRTIARTSAFVPPCF
jgi:hypothetical protein